MDKTLVAMMCTHHELFGSSRLHADLNNISWKYLDQNFEVQTPFLRSRSASAAEGDFGSASDVQWKLNRAKLVATQKCG
jgi:hypothetical protein